ncbi:MAG: four helix bundle protein [Nitrospirota bacterium]|nr:four helix bundle protein [Nitrospirota bacterium]
MEKLHKNLDAWRDAVELTPSIYYATDNFPRKHRFALTDQIHRAALNVASNIAEGAARQTKKEFANYLHIAQASLSELDTQHEIVKKLKFLSGELWCKLDAQMNHIDKLLSGLIKYLKSGKSQRTHPHPSPFTPYPSLLML